MHNNRSRTQGKKGHNGASEDIATKKYIMAKQDKIN